MKYIDSEKLIAEIERRKKAIHATIFNEAYDEVLSFITSLQQEQPEVDLEKEIKAEWDVIDADLLRFEEFKAVCYRIYELGQARKDE